MRNLLFSIRTRVLLLIGLAFAVFVGTMGFHAMAERRMRLESVKHVLLDHTRLIAAQQKHAIEYAQQFLESLIKAQNGRQTLLPEDCQSTLAQRLREEPRIANIAVALPDGSVACSATPTPRPINIADRPYFRNALASPTVVIGEVIDSRISGTQRLPFVKSVRDSSGRALGVFIVSIDLSQLARAIASSKYAKGARLGLIDAKGQVLARYPDVEGWVGKNVADTSFFNTVAAGGGEGTFEEIGLDGVTRVFGLARFAETMAGPISLWFGFAKDEVTAEVERDFAWTVLAIAVLLLLTFVTIWIGGERLLLRPISILSDTARRLSQGDLSARTGLEHTRNEFGRLAQSFDDMAKSLEAKDHQIVLASRAVKVLSTWNQALVTPRGEKSLIENMCRAIVEAGSYRGAWVGLAKSDENKTVEPVAWWGVDPGFVAGLGVSWADIAEGRGPTGAAIRRGAAVAMNDLMTNPDAAPWREILLRYDYKSIMSLPLKVDSAVIGALTLYTADSESFAEQEVVLLTEVAAALSSGIGAVRSHAARIQLEVSLQTSEERFRAAAEASLDALLVLKSVRDAAGNMVDFEVADMNDRAARELGLAKDEVIGKAFFQLLPVYGSAGFFNKYVHVVATRTSLEEEFPFDVPGAERKWFRQQVVAVGDGIAVSLRDITVWKTAGDKLRESEERLRLAMEAAHMGAWSSNIASGESSFSEGIGPIFGLAPGQGFRSTEAFLEVLHPTDREAMARAISNSIETGLSQTMEYRVIWPDGTLHWVEGRSNVTRDVSGKSVGLVGIAMDVTQRKQAAVVLQRANRALKTLSAANQALVRASSESGLLHEVCRVITEEGGYRMAWVGYSQNDHDKTIVAMAWAGVEGKYLAPVKHTWADNAQGQRPIAKAIRSGKTEIAHDVRGNPAYAAVSELMARPGYLSNIALPLLDGKNVIGAISIHAAEAVAFDEAEVLLLQELADDLAYGIVTLRTREERDRIAHAHEHHAAILRKSLEDSIQAIAATVEIRDPYTSGHQKRVAELAVALGREMGMSEDGIHGLHLAGVVHDLGKISVPAEILSKPGKLTPIEFMLIKGHAQAGYEILKDIDFPWPIATIVWQHHERFDGSGYPQGLKGDDILLESRIMAVADVVEAMASHRPYRPTLGIDVALQEIERGRGIQYDPAVADACLKMFREGRYALVT